MAEFLHMGGYAFYVWGSYGVVVVALVYHYLAPLRREKKLLRELAAERGIPPKTRKPAPPSPRRNPEP